MFEFSCINCGICGVEYENKDAFKKIFFKHFNQDHRLQIAVYGDCNCCVKNTNKFISTFWFGNGMTSEINNMTLKIIEYDFATCYNCIIEQEKSGMDIKESAI